MRPLRSSLPAVLLAVAAIALVGCSDSAPPDARSLELARVHNENLDQIASVDFQIEVWEETEQAIGDCMRSRGFDPYEPDPFFREVVIGSSGLIPWPTDDLDYGLVDYDPSLLPSFLDRSAAEIDALLDSCFLAVERSDDVQQLVAKRESVIEAEDKFFQALRFEPDFKDSLVDWSSCMEEQGRPFPDRSRMWSAVLRLDADEREEIGTADQACLDDSGHMTVVAKARETLLPRVLDALNPA